MGSGSDDASWNVVICHGRCERKMSEMQDIRLLKRVFTPGHFDCIIKISMCTGEGYL